MNRIIATPTLAAVFVWSASAETTRMQVPQGSGTFPTIGQVECLEEEGSGRYCAATYECGNGSSGDLWGDMANHNGRRPIGADSPVANQLDCVVSVDGKATVRWFHGHRPSGRDGNVVGLSPVVSPAPPTIRRDVRVSGGNESWLPWYIRTRNLGDVRATFRENLCGHIKEGTDQLNDCLSNQLPSHLREVGKRFAWALTPLTICATELAESYNRSSGSIGSTPLKLLSGHYHHNIPSSLRGAMDVMARQTPAHGTYYSGDVLEKFNECLELFQAEMMDHGLADPEE